MMNDAEAQMRFMFHLRAAGVTDARVLAALETVPRAPFVPTLFQAKSYEDTALPIACGQTISAPSIVAQMTQALAVTSRCKVLEVGTGSGYQAAILGRLARRVYTVERHKPLATTAETRLAALGFSNIVVLHADGADGVRAHAPFDRILVAAAAEDVPGPLLQALAPGGILVMPVESGRGGQQLLKVEKTPHELHYTELGPVRFVPLLGGLAEDMLD